MLRTKTLLLVLLVSTIFCACGKDKDEHAAQQDNTAVLSALRQVEHTYYDITHKYQDATLAELVDADTAVTVTIEEWQWNGDTLLSVTYTENGKPHHTLNFSYTERGRMLKDSRSPGQTTYYVYTDSRLDSIVLYDGTELRWTCAFGYTDDDMSSAIVKNYSESAETSSTTFELQFNDGDLIQLSYSSNGYHFQKNYTYATALNPYYLTDRTLTYLNLSRHVALTEEVVSTDSDGYSSNEEHTYNYTQQGTLPLTMDTENESYVGKYHNIYKHHYVFNYEF